MSSTAHSQKLPYSGRFKDQVAVVTGSSSGLGHALAIDLAHAGAIVFALGQSADRLGPLEGEISTVAPGSQAIVCDVSDTSMFIGILTRIERENKRIDVLINSTEAKLNPAPNDFDLDAFRRTLEIHLMAAIAGSYTVIPGMLERKNGIIANILDRCAPLPTPDYGAYSSSRAALSAFSESISSPLGQKGVKIHVVDPSCSKSKPHDDQDVSRRVLKCLGQGKRKINTSRSIRFFGF